MKLMLQDINKCFDIEYVRYAPCENAEWDFKLKVVCVATILNQDSKD